MIEPLLYMDALTRSKAYLRAGRDLICASVGMDRDGAAEIDIFVFQTVVYPYKYIPTTNFDPIPLFSFFSFSYSFPRSLLFSPIL